MPAADFSVDELLYLPRNLRAHRLYGMSPVEQITPTINIALRRDAATLDYYSAGSTPDAFATLPKEWTADPIRSFQDYFDVARERQPGSSSPDQVHARRLQADLGPPAARWPQQFRALEQKENIFLTAYAGFPVEPTFMIWNFNSGSAWTP